MDYKIIQNDLAQIAEWAADWSTKFPELDLDKLVSCTVSLYHCIIKYNPNIHNFNKYFYIFILIF